MSRKSMKLDNLSSKLEKVKQEMELQRKQFHDEMFSQFSDFLGTKEGCESYENDVETISELVDYCIDNKIDLKLKKK